MNERQLNQQLQALADQPIPAPGSLAARVMANLPDRSSPLELMLDRLLNWFSASPWRGAVTAALPLALGVVIGLTSTQPDNPDDTYWATAADLVYADTLEEYDYDEI